MEMNISLTEEEHVEILRRHFDGIWDKKLRVKLDQYHCIYACHITLTDEVLPPPIVPVVEPAPELVSEAEHDRRAAPEYDTPEPVFDPPPSYSGDSQGSVFDIPIKVEKPDPDDDIPF